MKIVRWDPFTNLLESVRRFEGLPADAGFRPAVDVYEVDDDLVFRVELPGVARDDIRVHIDNGVLTLAGERKRDERLTEASAYRVERAHGRFERSFALPEGYDSTRVKAVAKDGILELTLPRAERARSRTIAVEAA